VDLGRTHHERVAGRIREPAVDPGTGGIHTRTKFVEGTGVDQDIDPFPGQKLATAVLPVDVFLSASQFVLLLDVQVLLYGFFHSFAHFDSLQQDLTPV
jgi:hypothetical protein